MHQSGTIAGGVPVSSAPFVISRSPVRLWRVAPTNARPYQLIPPGSQLIPPNSTGIGQPIHLPSRDKSSIPVACRQADDQARDHPFRVGGGDWFGIEDGTSLAPDFRARFAGFI